jgi:antitoxin (DNA-binding transcriptional repressor) of toxin-antitoxin stability system
VKQITLQQLHEETARWVKEAASNGGIVVTVDGKPVATLTQFTSEKRAVWTKERLEAIRKQPFISVDSGDLISQDRNRS